MSKRELTPNTSVLATDLPAAARPRGLNPGSFDLAEAATILATTFRLPNDKIRGKRRATGVDHKPNV